MSRLSGFILTFLSVLLSSFPALAGQLINWNFNASQNRFTFYTDSRVQPTAQLIPNPTRIVVDLPGTTLRGPTVRQPGGGRVREIRIGEPDSATTRVVIELDSGYTVDPQKVKVRGITPTQWVVELPTPEVAPPNNSALPPQGALPPNGDRPEFQRLSVLSPSTLTPNAAPSQPEGGIVLRPKSETRSQDLSPSARPVTIASLAGGGLPHREPSPMAQLPRSWGLATITSIDITRDDSQLLIRGDRAISAKGSLNRLTGNYEVRINQAQLPQQFQGPTLEANGPVYQLTIRQETPDTVLVIVHPNNGRRFGRFFRSGGSLYALELLRDASAVRPRPPGQGASNGDQIPIAVIPPPANAQPSFPPNTRPLPPTDFPRVPQGSRLVIIDPGHGGKDPGAIGINGVQEKDVIMPISQYVAQYLEQQGVRVIMTRTSDYFVSLQGRTDMANRARADAFVSIHANSMGMGRPDVSGFEIYYFGNAALSRAIHRQVIRSVDVKDRGVRQARFYVLRHSRMPSTLVETGFVTGAEDNAKLTNPAYQQQMAQAIARGILDYLQQR